MIKGEKNMKKLIIMLAVCTFILTGCGKEVQTSNESLESNSKVQNESVQSEEYDTYDTLDNAELFDGFDTDESSFEQESVIEQESVTELEEVANVSVEVIDALTYERRITPSPSVDVGDFSHCVNIPMITGESDAVKAFNQRIYDKYITYKDELEAGYINHQLKADSSIDGDRKHVQITYKYSVNDNIAAILVDCITAALPGDGSIRSVAFYFDAANDEEISFDEYLERLNIDYDKLNALAKVKLGYDDDFYYVANAIIAEGNVKAVFNAPIGLGMNAVVLDCSLDDIMR